MTEEDLAKAVSVRASDWIMENVKDPMAQAVFMNIGPIIGTDVKEVHFAQLSSSLGTFNSVGAPLLWYPTDGNLQSAIIDPLAEYYTQHGGEILTGRAVRTILIEDGKTTGVLIVEDMNPTMLAVNNIFV